jgi:protein-S-isoprenylcysteine O-methyltransferase Ste14
METRPTDQKINNKATPAKKISTKAILRVIIFLLLLPLLLFGSAGRIDWCMGWAYISIYLGATFISRLIVVVKYPQLLAERAQFTEAEGVKSWDKVIVPLVALYGPLVVIILTGIDKRFSWSPELPQYFQLVALVAVLLGFVISTWAMSTNRFFSSVVRIQKDRGHSVVSDGPYQIVRHPAYAGMILSQIAAPIMLNSLWALIPTALVVAGVVARTYLEDKELLTELSGYTQYALRTRYRLVPGIW